MTIPPRGPITSTSLRDYQLRTISEWAEAPERSVCIVAPTGAGKSVLGREIAGSAVRNGGRVLWLAHRIELLTQAVGHLARVNVPAGILAAGYDREPHAPVQCASVDTLLARPNDRPPADLIVWDEAHHSVAETYRTLLDSYPAARIVGLTATPQRQDGKPLGDIFERLIVAAQYSELLTAGHIAPCRVFRPEEHLGSDLACPPLEAYQKWGNGERGFGFANSVQSAHTLAREFTEAGIPSAAIDGRMSDADRAAALRAFTAGRLRILWNMHVLTEGVDVPDASVCILARNPGHAGGYLQAVGRVLRTHPGKTTARLIDLTGCSHKHGLPTSDREYALNGRAIRCAEEPVRNCAECGCTYPQASDSCPECGAEPKREPRQLPRIWSLELREAFESDNVTADHKTNEWYRLVSLCEQRGWSLTWAVKQYAGLFQESPPIERVTPEQRTRELARLIRDAATRGHKAGAAAHRYKAIFGVFPSRFMTAQAQGHSR